MANFKRIENPDLAAISKPLSEKEQKAFNDFLKDLKPDSKGKARFFSKAPKRETAR